MSLSLANPLISVIAAMICGYIVGSVPFGLLLTRMAGLGDIRTIGSGNIGATNVLRTGNRSLAALTLLLDAGKGAAAIFIVWLLADGSGGGQVAVASPQAAAQGLSDTIVPLAVGAGYGAFLGHVYPVWLGFRGGKGVATYIGVLLALYWPAGAIFCGTWLLLAVLMRYSSLSALVAALVAPLSVALFGHGTLALMLLPLTFLLIFKHRENIGRLIAGTEPKIGAKA